MITIYTRTTCAQCRTVKKFFDIKGIKYNLINLDEPEHWDLAQSLDKMGLRNVPITTNKERSRYVTGFNAGELTKLIQHG